MSDRSADDAAAGGSARYGQRGGTGSNDPSRGEKKEQRDDWIHRQGGDQTRDSNRDGRRLGDVRDGEDDR